MKKVCSIIVVIAAFSLSSFAALPAAAYSYQFGMLETFDSMGTSSTNAPKLNGTNLWSVMAANVESATKLKTVAPSTSISSSRTVITGYNAGSAGTTNRTLALFVDGTANTNSYFVTRFVNATTNTLTSIEMYYDLEVCWIHLVSAHGTPQAGNLTASISTNGTKWVSLTNLNGSVSSSTNATKSAVWLTDAEMDTQKLSKRNIGGIISLPTNLPSIKPGQGFYIRWTVDTGSKDMIYGIDNLSVGPKDSDRDGMPDVWEVANRFSPTNSLDAALDADNDGLTNLQEYLKGTNPRNPDTDGDGLPDGWEVANGFDPLVNDAAADADNDGLTNLQEYLKGTNPRNPDTDGDGLPDGWEVLYTLSPTNAVGVDGASGDPDNDGLTNLQEYLKGTNPRNPDTDGDGMPDGWEVANNFDPRVNDASADADNDGLTNLQEYLKGTNPRLADTDGDGMPDGWEVANGFDPLVNDAAADADNDGLTNLQEYLKGTNPRNPDTDGDGLPDGWEVANNFSPTNSLDALLDADNDGLTNLQEYLKGTNPNNLDTDGDGQSDGEEVTKGTNPLDPTSFTIVLKSSFSPSPGLEKNVVQWPKSEGKYYTLLFSETVTGTYTPVTGCIRVEKQIGVEDAGCSHVTTSETGFYKVLVETN